MKRNFPQFIITVFVLIITAVPVHADGTHPRGIKLDGTIGTAGKADLPGPAYEIRAEYGRQAGSNLFHSFRQFNIHSDESATFNGPASVQNIITRVTGEDSSWIDGRLCSEIPGADLYLLNPAGVMFGPDAALDLDGSFHVSTADYLRMGEHEQFYTEPLESDVLSSAPPAEFGFSDDTPSGISLEKSFLEVPDEETISLVGGDIQMHDTTLFAREGRINLASAASAGEVRLHETGIETGGTSATLGEISISRDAGLRKFDEQTYLGNLEVGGMEVGRDGGAIFIQGGRFELRSGLIGANTSGGMDGKGISIRVTDDVVIDGGAIESGTSGTGNAGNVEIEAKQFTVKKGGYITAGSIGSGAGGEISISAAESVSISGKSENVFSGLYADTHARGKGGRISLSSLRIMIDDSGIITAGSQGHGDAGEISLDTDMLALNGGAHLKTTAYGDGSGGDIRISASELVRISGESDYSYSGLYADTHAEGSGGNIILSAAKAEIADRGVITARTDGSGSAGGISLDVNTLTVSGGAYIATDTSESGSGGTISISASESVNISGMDAIGGFYANTYGEGKGGSITVSTPGIEISKIGMITAGTQGDGDAGEISMDVNTLTMTDGAQIITDSYGNGRGGNIRISADESVSIFGGNDPDFYSGIGSNTVNSQGGTVTVSAPDLTIAENGKIRAQTLGKGNGGEIRLNADTVTLTSGGFVGTEAVGSGNGGNISISANKSVNISGKGMFSSGFYAASLFASGDGGSIVVSTSDLTLDEEGEISAETTGIGKAGKIELDAKTLTLKGGGMISTDTIGMGPGGDIHISAEDSVNISGKGKYFSGLYSNTYPGGDRNGGSIIVSASDLTIDRGGKIQAGTGGDGDAGKIRVNLDTLKMSDGARISTESVGRGQGGDIEMYMSGLNMENNTFVTAESTGTGEGGTIAIHADEAVRMHGTITTKTLRADGGNIVVNAGSLLHLTDGEISTSVQGGMGDGGNISIDPPEFAILNHSKIIANAYEGDGGNIRISADQFIQSSGSIVSASSQLLKCCFKFYS
ncbi:filamentous hemagglutinin N-terminal domain-containing protein [Desulfococcaceae bacterium HSG8]|nr:filamentous hemagglutinin N-terminal domain-containing protein [Desulfococcaceae bacterium HSG8]